MNNVVQVEKNSSNTKSSIPYQSSLGNRFDLRRTVAAFIALLFLLAIAAVAFSRELLTVDSGEAKADVIVLLGGGASDRPERAPELFKEGVAPKVLVSGVGYTIQNVERLEKNGVPAVDIREENNSTSTLENAKYSIPMLRQMGVHRVILVTSWYHSRRAMACFEHFAPDLIFYSRPSYVSYASDETNVTRVFRRVLPEFMKLPGYWLCYGVRPFP